MGKLHQTYSFSHANTSVFNCQGLVLLVWDDVNSQVLARIKLARVRKGLVADLVESIGAVGNQFSEEDFLVGIDSVDDERQKLRDLSLELKGLRHLGDVMNKLTAENCWVS